MQSMKPARRAPVDRADEYIAANSNTDSSGTANSNAEALSLTVKQASQLLQLDVRTIRDMFHRGDIAGNQVGRAIRIDRQSVVMWVRGKCSGSRSGRS